MRICLSAVELFLSYLAGENKAEEVLAHPAYVAVNAHAKLIHGREYNPHDLDQAVAGADSPFFGLRDVRERLPQIQSVLEHIHINRTTWESLIETQLAKFVPDRLLRDITIYPTIGYDVGIGLNGTVSMNINWPWYFSAPQEFLSLSIHETFHVAYDRLHSLPSMDSLETIDNWLEFFFMLVQNEGYAVYAPLALRQQDGWGNDETSPISKDYAVLGDELRRTEHIRIFMSLVDSLRTTPPNTREQYLELLFTDERLTYRVGAY
ncbi:MAG: hypothetical protein Q8S19_06720, partial [Bacillota bacterium]|nr:hypothetical protein [Bacillota bacterium]